MNRYLIRANGQATLRGNVRSALKERHITQTAAAERADIPYWRLVSCLAANSWFREHEVYAIAAIVGLDFDELVGDSVFQDDPRVRYRPAHRRHDRPEIQEIDPMPDLPLDVSGWVARCLEDGITAADLDIALGRVGRNYGPALLAALHDYGILTVDQLAAKIGEVWSMAEYPDRALGHDRWFELFDVAGYTENGNRAEPPAEPLTLYRGSVDNRRGDWSWTDDRTVAYRYADGQHYQRPRGTVWRATVTPDRLLARNTERDESEYVVNTAGLAIERDEATDAQCFDDTVAGVAWLRAHRRGDAAAQRALVQQHGPERLMAAIAQVTNSVLAVQTDDPDTFLADVAHHSAATRDHLLSSEGTTR